MIDELNSWIVSGMSIKSLSGSSGVDATSSLGIIVSLR